MGVPPLLCLLTVVLCTLLPVGPDALVGFSSISNRHDFAPAVMPVLFSTMHLLLCEWLQESSSSDKKKQRVNAFGETPLPEVLQLVQSHSVEKVEAKVQEHAAFVKHAGLAGARQPLVAMNGNLRQYRGSPQVLCSRSVVC